MPPLGLLSKGWPAQTFVCIFQTLLFSQALG